jgi:hypothetical protein
MSPKKYEEEYVTKGDLHELESRLTEQHEKRIQMVSAHYSSVLKSNQELTTKVCGFSEKQDILLEQIQPILDAQKVLISIHAFLKWIGLPFTTLGLFIWWMWNKI